jgi:hypothetical protein
MSEHIPFITSQEAADVTGRVFSDSEIVRVLAYHQLRLPQHAKLWVDPAVDGIDDWVEKTSHRNSSGKIEAFNPVWAAYVRGLSNYERLVDHDFWKKPDKAIVEQFVRSVLDKCNQKHPAWITVPQLPVPRDSTRNKINRALAAAAGDWRSASKFTGRMILPVILTHQDMVNSKTGRNPKVKEAQRCFIDARAEGIWVVETDLDDDSGSGNMRQRIESLIRLHEELNQTVAANIRIAGPYWGTNLVLWSRNLVNYPAIGIGGGYTYVTAGGLARSPLSRVAISPLRRIAKVVGLDVWLKDAMAKITSAHPAYKEFEGLLAKLPGLAASLPAKLHVAQFYKKWFDMLAVAPVQGRSMTLFQDLSAAFALGKALPLMDRSEDNRKPYGVAEPLMMNCL